MTKRVRVLAVVAAAGLTAMAVAAAQAPTAAAQAARPQAKVVTVDKLKDNLYVLKGGGGNTALFLTADGAVVVDSKLAGWGRPLLQAIRSVTKKPLTMVINTHTHYDHTNGQVEFPASVEVVAHENTKTYMEEANPVYALQTGPQPNLFKTRGGRGLPTRTFKDALTIGSGADRIDLHYFGRAHTGGDTYVVFPALGVMHVGDTFPSRDLPIMDLNNGGSGLAFAATLTKAAAVSGRDDDHQRPQPRADDTSRPQDLRRVHRRLRDRRAGREEGRQDRGRRRGGVEDAGQVRRLRHAATGAGEGRRAGYLHRDQVGRFDMTRVPLLILAALWAVPAAAQPARPAPPLENIKVLKGWTSAEVREEMRRMSDAIGVRCGHCHVQSNFASDEKRAKHTGRRMLTLTLALNTEYFPGHQPAAGESKLGRVTCYTCHQGAATPRLSAGFGELAR